MSFSRLDSDRVLAFLRQRVGSGIDSLQPVSHGEWSRAFFFRHSDQDLVVRFSVFGDDFLKDQRAMRYASTRLPIPRLLEMGPAFDDYVYAVSERATGDFFEERDAQAMRRLLPSVFATLDAARDVDVSETTGFGLWRGADGNAPYATWRDTLRAIATDPPSNRTHGWRDRLAQLPESHQVFEAGYERMLSLLDACPERERHLLHSDLLNFNVLVRDDCVSAVLDWGSSMYGDFLWDLAWLTFWQPWYTAWANVDLRSAARRHYQSSGSSVPNFAERLRCYELAIGLDGIAYQSYVGHTEDCAWTTRRVESLIHAPVA